MRNPDIATAFSAPMAHSDCCVKTGGHTLTIISVISEIGG